MERRWAARVASQCDTPISETTTAPTGEHVTPEPRFPHEMRNVATAYASSASTDVVAYEDLPGHHLLAVRNLIATTNDESYHGSASELSPATSHGYAGWDFCGVPDPVMFQRFLDAADYWFGCSDDSSTGRYDPMHECFVVVVDEQADGTNAVGAGDEEAPRNPGAGVPQNPGPSAPPPHRRGALTSTRSWLKRASLRLTSRKSIARYDCFVPPSLERLPRAANVRASWASRPASATTPTSTSTTRTRPSEQSQKLITAAMLLWAMLAPSTPEVQNLHSEAQALIEQVAVQQAESSASRIHQQGIARDDGGAQGPEASVHAGGGGRTTGQRRPNAGQEANP
jgi:hypothetical protein